MVSGYCPDCHPDCHPDCRPECRPEYRPGTRGGCLFGDCTCTAPCGCVTGVRLYGGLMGYGGVVNALEWLCVGVLWFAPSTGEGEVYHMDV